MNKYLAWLPVIMLIGGSLYTPVKEAREDKPANKSISFAVYKSNSYASDAYNNTTAQVHIILEKVRGNERTVLWDTVLDAKSLKDYPTEQEPFNKTLTVSGVKDGRDHLEVRYILTYISNGSQLQMQDGTAVSAEGSSKVNISI